MELSTEDKQRIEQEAKEAEKNRSMHDVYSQITPYVSGYILGSIIERRKLEAERSELQDKYKSLWLSVQRFHQTLIARNYNNIGVWHNERQEYNYELISEVEALLNSLKK